MKNVIIVSITLIVVALILVVVMFSKNIIDVKNAKVTVNSCFDEVYSVELTDAEDAKETAIILTQNKRYIEDSPACPYGYIEIVVSDDDESYKFYPATDSCTIVCRVDKEGNRKYCQFSDEEWKKLFDILKKYEVYHQKKV